MKRFIVALLVVLLPAIALADLCGSNKETSATLAASTPTVVGTGLAGRKLITVCSESGNASSSVVQCRGDGTVVALGATLPGARINPGQCVQFGSPGGVAVTCVANTAGTNVQVQECTGTDPPSWVVNGPPSSSTGSSTVAQGSAGSSSWPVKVTDATTPAQTLAIDSSGKIGVSSLPAITGSVTATVASVGATGSDVPASASYMAGDNAAGKLTGVKIGATGGVIVEGAASGVPIPTSSAYSGPVTATWDSTTIGDTALQIGTNGFTTVGIQYVKTGVVTAGVITFETSYSASGPWTPIAVVVTTGDTSSATYTLTTGSTGWQAFVSGYPYFQIRLSTVITGAGSATLAMMASQAGVRPGSGAVHGDRAANTVLPDSRMLGTMPVISTAVAPSLTEGYVQALSADLAGNLRGIVQGYGTSGAAAGGVISIQGTKADNAAAPSTNLGVLPAVATAADPTRTEGYQGTMSMDLAGYVRVVKKAPTAVATASTPGTCTAVTTSATPITTNASRHSVMIQAPTTNTANLRWAKAAAATAAQMVLAPGQTFIFDAAGGHIYTGPYSFISEDGTSQTVCAQEE